MYYRHRCSDLFERAAVLVLMQIVVLPEDEEITEVLQHPLAGRLRGGGWGRPPAPRPPGRSEGAQVARHVALLVRKHQEDEGGVETADVLLVTERITPEHVICVKEPTDWLPRCPIYGAMHIAPFPQRLTLIQASHTFIQASHTLPPPPCTLFPAKHHFHHTSHFFPSVSHSSKHPALLPSTSHISKLFAQHLTPFSPSASLFSQLLPLLPTKRCPETAGYRCTAGCGSHTSSAWSEHSPAWGSVRWLGW